MNQAYLYDDLCERDINENQNWARKKMRKGKTDFRFVSVPNFFEDVSGSINTEVELEKDVIDQLLLTSNPNQFPDSSIARLIQIKFKYIIVLYAAICFLIAFANNWKIKLGKNSTLNSLAIAIAIILGFVAFYFMVHFLGKLTLNLSAKFSLGKTEFQTSLVPKDSNNNEDKFVQCNDELRYFFNVTKVRYIIFEDLDRYETPLIFQRLRSLNKRLNSYRDEPIVFIYTLKDSIFVNEKSNERSNEETNTDENFAAEQKVKFFDYIIPIFPLHSFENSRTEFVVELLNYGYSKTLFDKDIFYELGKYIHDKREIINIICDFDVYFQKLNLDSIEMNRDKKEANNKLLGLMVYKNVYPDDFVKLTKGDAFLTQLMNDFSSIEVKEQHDWKDIIQFINERNVDKSNLRKQEKEDLKKLFSLPILSLLIKKGYLGNDYYNYISPTFFSISSARDRTFVNKVIDHKTINEDFPLKNVETIISYFNQIGADYKYAFSSDLLRGLGQYNQDSESQRHIEEILLIGIKRKRYVFISIALQNDKNLIGFVMKEVISRWPEFYEDVLTANTKEKSFLIDQVLGFIVRPNEISIKVLKLLKKNKLLDKNEYRQQLIRKIKSNDIFNNDFKALLKHSKIKYHFNDISNYAFDSQLFDYIVRCNWFDRMQRLNYVSIMRYLWPNYNVKILNKMVKIPVEIVESFYCTTTSYWNVKLLKKFIVFGKIKNIDKYNWTQDVLWMCKKGKVCKEDSDILKYEIRKNLKIEPDSFYIWVMQSSANTVFKDIIRNDSKFPRNSMSVKLIREYANCYIDKSITKEVLRYLKKYKLMLQN